MRAIEFIAWLHPTNFGESYPSLWHVVARIAGLPWSAKQMMKMGVNIEVSDESEGNIETGIHKAAAAYQGPFKPRLRWRVVRYLAEHLCNKLIGHELSKVEFGYSGGEYIDHWCRWCGKRIPVPKMEAILPPEMEDVVREMDERHEQEKSP